VTEAPDYLKRDGLLYLEIGHDQGIEVCCLAGDSGHFEDISVVKDLAGHDRVVKCRRKEPEKKSRRKKTK
jgi:release factor glutamine methyltransferase